MQRDCYIDVVAGLMIVTMVLSHTYDDRLSFDILNFFMPWFFFKSGMYFREGDIRKTIYDGIKKLLYPFMTFTLLGYLVYVVQKILVNDSNWIHYILTPLKELVLAGCIEGNLPLWFLVSFFVVRVLFQWAYRPKFWHIVLNLGVILILLFVVNIFNDNPYFPLYVTSTLIGYFFYGCGYLFRDTHKNVKLWCVACAVFLIVFFVDRPTMVMRVNYLRHGHYFLWFVFSLFGCITVNGLVNRIPYKFPVLRWIGVNSMIIYVTHYLVIKIFNITVSSVMHTNLSADTRLLFLIPIVIVAEYFIVRMMQYKQFQILIKPYK